MNHFISVKNFSQNQIQSLVDLALKIKADQGSYAKSLSGKSVGLIFEKPSLRTKTAFYIGALQLGSGAIY